MNILILGYNFYGYEKEILLELRKRNNVIFVNLETVFTDRLYLNIIKKIKKREIIFSEFYQKKIKKELEKGRFKNREIDILFVLGFAYFNEQHLKYLNKYFNIKKKYLYLWDSANRTENIDLYKKIFDKIFSFDKKDCIKNNFIYRPTFYSKRLEKLGNTKIIYLSSFIGAYSPTRNYLLNNIIKKSFKNNFIYLYLSFFSYVKNYLFNKDYKIKNINFFKVSKEKYNLIMSQSEVIIDLLQFNQTGVTQRTLDALYLNKKIITNNEYIKDYDFYNSNNILIINKKTTEREIRNFKDKKYIEINKDIIEYYSLEKWIKDIFE